MRLSTRLSSAFAILFYLAAALSPCEGPERLRIASAQLHAAALSPQGPPELPDRRMNAVRDEHAHDHSTHDHADGDGPGRHQPALTRSVAHVSSSHDASHHASKGEKKRGTAAFNRAHSNDPAVAQLEFTAPCVCGCGDTRATVGGGASRLGAVVPGQFVPELLSIPVENASRRDPGRFVLQILEIDPIPI